MDFGALWFRFAGWFCRTFFYGPLGGITVQNAENFPLTGPILVAPVHLSHVDPPLVGSISPRKLHFMAKRELFKFPLGPLIKSLGAFPVSRGEGDSAAIRRTLLELENGAAILIFPEGTRGDGITLGKIQIGLAMMAKKSGAQILPIGINGTQKMLPRGTSRPKRARMIVCIGKPFTYAEIATSDNERENRTAFVNELTKRLMEACDSAGLHLNPPG